MERRVGEVSPVLETPVLVVTGSVVVRDTVHLLLTRCGIPLRDQVSAVGAPLRSVSAVVCTLDADWRELARPKPGTVEIPPPVVVLTPEPDPRFWAEALLHGAFDAIAMTEGPERLTGAVEKARMRWQRARSVREALKQNAAMVRDVA